MTSYSRGRRSVLRAMSLLVCAWIGTAAPLADALAQDAFVPGAEAYRRGEFAEAMAILRPLADTGDAAAQFYIGQMYQGGKGVPEDLAAAVDWYRKGAEGNWPSAQKNLADLYYLGKGTAQDYAAAASWYVKAAKAGHAEAQYMMGHMYHRGLGIAKNVDLAVMWYRTAADQGYEIGDVLIGLE